MDLTIGDYFLGGSFWVWALYLIKYMYKNRKVN